MQLAHTRSVLVPLGLVLALQALQACCCCRPCDDGAVQCVDFEDHASGTSFAVGGSFADSGVTISVNAYRPPSSSGQAVIDSNNHAFGTGNAGRPNNCNLAFGFAPASKITLKLGELGGSCNLAVNGDQRQFADFTVGTISVGGCDVTFVKSSPAGHNYWGTLTVVGAIDSFEIGGQELWIDDVCATAR